jgi:hypothetical protein
MNRGNYDYVFTVDNYGTMFDQIGCGSLNVYGFPSERSTPLSNKSIDTIKACVEKPFHSRIYYNDVFQSIVSFCDEAEASAAELVRLRAMLAQRTEELEASQAEVVRLTKVYTSCDTSSALQHCEEELNRLKPIGGEQRRTNVVASTNAMAGNEMETDPV